MDRDDQLTSPHQRPYRYSIPALLSSKVSAPTNITPKSAVYDLSFLDMTLILLTELSSEQTTCPRDFLGEGKPGGFQTRGVFHFFRERYRLIVSQTLSGLFLVGAVNRHRENPRQSPDKSGKSRKNRENPQKKSQKRGSKKDKKKQGRIQIGKPRYLKPHCLPASMKIEKLFIHRIAAPPPLKSVY